MFSIRIAAALTTSRPVRRTPSVTVCRLPTQLMLLWLAFKKNRDQNYQSTAALAGIAD